MKKVYAHFKGPTVATYSRDGTQIFTGGVTGQFKRYTEEEDPDSFWFDSSNTKESGLNKLTACDTNDTGLVIGCSTGVVNAFATNGDYLKTVTRAPFAVTKVAFSPDGQLVAVSNKGDLIAIVDWAAKRKVKDITVAGITDFAWSADSLQLVTSGHDGISLIDIESMEPAHSSVDYSRAKVAYHPEGTVIAVSLPTDVALVDKQFKEQSRFAVEAKVLQMEFSPSGEYLAIAFPLSVEVWSVKDRKKLASNKDAAGVCAMDWHPHDNELIISNDIGELIYWNDVIPGTSAPSKNVAFKETTDGDELADTPNDSDLDTPEPGETAAEEYPATMALGNDFPDTMALNNEPAGTMALNDEIDATLGLVKDDYPATLALPREPEDVNMDEPGDSRVGEVAEEALDLGSEGLFVEDDDGAGYLPSLKRPHEDGYDDDMDDDNQKRVATGYYDDGDAGAFQPGATAYDGDRRYLAASLDGYIWTVKQEEDRHSITVTFFNRDVHRDYHFTDTTGFQLAAMSTNAALFARISPPSLYLRFHSGHTENWSHDLDENDPIRCISVSKSMCVVCTESGLILTYSIFGIPLRVYRDAGDPAISVAAHDDTFVMIRQESFTHKLNYTCEDGDGQIYCRGRLSIAASGHIQYLCFTENGDPAIYDSEGVLLVLSRWREPGQARWIPLLDTVAMAKEHKREEKYWPLGIDSDYNFHCVILKGVAEQPILPMPIPSEFPIHPPGETRPVELEFLKKSIICELEEGRVKPQNLFKCELEVDTALLRLLQAACRDTLRLNKSLSIFRLIRGPKAKEAAVKIANRYGHTLLAEKITDIIEEEPEEGEDE